MFARDNKFRLKFLPSESSNAQESRENSNVNEQPKQTQTNTEGTKELEEVRDLIGAEKNRVNRLKDKNNIVAFKRPSAKLLFTEGVGGFFKALDQRVEARMVRSASGLKERMSNNPFTGAIAKSEKMVKTLSRNPDLMVVAEARNALAELKELDNGTNPIDLNTQPELKNKLLAALTAHYNNKKDALTKLKQWSRFLKSPAIDNAPIRNMLENIVNDHEFKVAGVLLKHKEEHNEISGELLSKITGATNVAVKQGVLEALTDSSEKHPFSQIYQNLLSTQSAFGDQRENSNFALLQAEIARFQQNGNRAVVDDVSTENASSGEPSVLI